MRVPVAEALAGIVDILPILQVEEVLSDRLKELLFMGNSSIVAEIKQETGM